jgi:hypothetical protein
VNSENNTDHGCYTEHGVTGYGVAAKLSRGKPMETSFVKAMAEEMMMSIAQKCIDSGAKCIGHIKCHIKTEAGTIKADTIGISHGTYSSGKLDTAVTDLYIAVNSIIQGIKEDAVKNATLNGLHEVAESKGVDVVKEKEHSYFDEFDFVASKQEYIKQLEKQLFEDEKPR